MLARAGERLGRVTAPALVVWGTREPFIGIRFAQAYADALGGEARVEMIDGAGHWPWLEQPDVVERVGAFLDG